MVPLEADPGYGVVYKGIVTRTFSLLDGLIEGYPGTESIAAGDVT